MTLCSATTLSFSSPGPPTYNSHVQRGVKVRCMTLIVQPRILGKMRFVVESMHAASLNCQPGESHSIPPLTRFAAWFAWSRIVFASFVTVFGVMKHERRKMTHRELEVVTENSLLPLFLGLSLLSRCCYWGKQNNKNRRKEKGNFWAKKTTLLQGRRGESACCSKTTAKASLRTVKYIAEALSGP